MNCSLKRPLLFLQVMGLTSTFLRGATLENADKFGKIQKWLYAKIEFRSKERRRYWGGLLTSIIKNTQIS